MQAWWHSFEAGLAQWNKTVPPGLIIKYQTKQTNKQNKSAVKYLPLVVAVKGLEVLDLVVAKNRGKYFYIICSSDEFDLKFPELSQVKLKSFKLNKQNKSSVKYLPLVVAVKGLEVLDLVVAKNRGKYFYII
jgi:hypothetical protein